MKNCIILIGPPGSGKSDTGRCLAKKLGWEFVDTDKVIEESCGLTIAQVFAKYGEGIFRNLESCFLGDLDAQPAPGKGMIIATGGGLPITPGNLERLQELGKVVLLTADTNTLVARLAQGGVRPLLLSTEAGMDAENKALPDSERLELLCKQRQAVYDRAEYKIDTRGLDADQVAGEILKLTKS